MSAAAVLSPKRTFTAARCAELLHFALDRTDAEREVQRGAIAGTIQELDRAMDRLASVRLVSSRRRTGPRSPLSRGRAARTRGWRPAHVSAEPRRPARSGSPGHWTRSCR